MPIKIVDQKAGVDRPRMLWQSLVGPLCVATAMMSLTSDKAGQTLAGTLLLASGILFSTVAIVDAAKGKKQGATMPRSERTGTGAVKF